MLILAIETSCDETSAAVVENGWKVHSNIIASQVEIHAKTGGVIPEVAAREHVLKIIPVIDQALKEANKTLNDIDAIAVTSHPGLI
ncbi:MAG: putative tRNA threonylcarbamoyladenosine biosynthesis protein Gcp, partial [Candidatus Peregrinibacteria bacterium GW2011_GWA2_33_10]